jgi:hypothetical protein
MSAVYLGALAAMKATHSVIAKLACGGDNASERCGYYPATAPHLVAPARTLEPGNLSLEDC